MKLLFLLRFGYLSGKSLTLSKACFGAGDSSSVSPLKWTPEILITRLSRSGLQNNLRESPDIIAEAYKASEWQMLPYL